MRITIETTKLKDCLEVVSRVSTKHVTLPILQCVQLEVINSMLILRATNLEIGVEIAADARVEEDGVVAVPTQVFTQVIGLVSTKEVVLESDEGVLSVVAGGSRSDLKVMAHDEFPSLPKIAADGQVVNGSMFALGLKTAAFAASQSSIKPELGSINVFQKKEHSLTFVATDSFRLMEKTVPQKGVMLDDAVLIPYKNALEIARVCDLVGEDPEFRVSDNQCSLTFASGVYITTRLTNGSFPDYAQIIPKEYVTHATVLKNDLVQAFKKTGVFLNKFMQVGVSVLATEVLVSSQNGEVGTTSEQVKAQVEGTELSLSFNQRYVAEAMSHFVDDSVIMHFAGVGRPMVMEGVVDRSVRYLVMPMNK